MIASNVASNINVGAGIQGRQKIELLKNKSDLAAPHAGALRVAQLGEVGLINYNSARIRPRETTQNIEESGFTTS